MLKVVIWILVICHGTRRFNIDKLMSKILYNRNDNNYNHNFIIIILLAISLSFSLWEFMLNTNKNLFLFERTVDF